MVVEGIRTCKAAYEYAQTHDLELPIIDAIYNVLFNKMDPNLALKSLLSRKVKAE